MAWVIEGQTQSMIVQRKDTVTGSAGDKLSLMDFTSFQMSAMDTLLKLTSSVRDCTSVRTGLQRMAMQERIFSI